MSEEYEICLIRKGEDGQMVLEKELYTGPITLTPTIAQVCEQSTVLAVAAPHTTEDIDEVRNLLTQEGWYFENVDNKVVIIRPGTNTSERKEIVNLIKKDKSIKTEIRRDFERIETLHLGEGSYKEIITNIIVDLIYEKQMDIGQIKKKHAIQEKDIGPLIGIICSYPNIFQYVDGPSNKERTVAIQQENFDDILIFCEKKGWIVPKNHMIGDLKYEEYLKKRFETKERENILRNFNVFLERVLSPSTSGVTINLRTSNIYNVHHIEVLFFKVWGLEILVMLQKGLVGIGASFIVETLKEELIENTITLRQIQQFVTPIVLGLRFSDRAKDVARRRAVVLMSDEEMIRLLYSISQIEEEKRVRYVKLLGIALKRAYNESQTRPLVSSSVALSQLSRLEEIERERSEKGGVD